VTYIVVFLLSLATLAFELSVTRVFSIVQWDSLAFLAISIAMFGGAAAGVAFFLARQRHGRGQRADAASGTPARYAAMCLGCAAGIAGSFLAVNRLPLDWLRFAVDPAQPAWLALAYLAASLPFFASGLATCTAYADRPEASGRVAAASLAGSAAGAALPALLLPALGEGGTVAAAALAALLPCLLLPFPKHTDRPDARRTAVTATAAGAAALAAAIVAAMAWPGSTLLAVRPSPYKSLPQLLQVPGTRVTAVSTGLNGRLETVESPLLRFAPGLSLSWQGTLPRQTGLYLDGDTLTVLHDLAGAGVAFARSTHAFAAYRLASPVERCLVVQAGGGLGAACALASGARETTIACGHPGIAAATNTWYAGRGLTAVAGNPRSLLARAGSPWDVIHVESWGPSVQGMAGLAEEALLTRDALLACWNRLSDRGVLVVSRRLLVPPSDAVRIFATALEALGVAGVAEPASHLAVVRGWDSCSLLVSRAAIIGGRLAELRAFADGLGFDLDWFPGMHREDADRFGRFERPLFYEAYRSVLDDPSWPAVQPLDVVPQSDDRPFPNRFVRWTRLREFLGLAGGRSALLLAPELIAAAGLALAVVLGAALVGAAAVAGRGRNDRRRLAGSAGAAADAAGEASAPALPALLLFALLGAGFLLAEIGIVDAFTVLFANPPAALSLVLGGMLAAAALGGFCSKSLGSRALPAALAASAACLAAGAALLLPGFRLLLPLPAVPRAAAALALIAVPSFCLGMTFPLAMRDLGGSPGGRAWAWAVNGSASVIASIAAALVAAAWGISALLYAAASAYALALCMAAMLSLRDRSAIRLRAFPSTPPGRGR
jgi:hypothetical protein